MAWKDPCVRVYVSRRVPDQVRTELEALFDIEMHDSERAPERTELLDRCRGAHGLVTMLTDRVDAELLDGAGPQLRVVANYAVGVDNVDLDAAVERDVVVANTPDVLTRATAEFTIALLLTVTRRVAEGDRLLRRGDTWTWAPTFMLGTGLEGKTLGIVGLGRIGREVAALGEAFGMHTIHTSRTGGVPLDELLDEADVVSLHCPLTPETRHLIDADALARMRTSAFLVNTARGPIVDEGALADALGRRAIAGAALDVFEREPDVNERLRRLDNAVLAPHLASATTETREAMGMLCVEALRSVLLEGRVPANAVTA
jgi:lactate dehydrogenase-like 2-hydroxyacid dehydrogenase